MARESRKFILLLVIAVSACGSPKSYERYTGANLTPMQKCVNRCDANYGRAEKSCGSSGLASAFSGNPMANLNFQMCTSQARDVRDECAERCQ